ncbi:hypothetical protein IFM89_012956 [Coptis chinensis]|uniref:SAC domain-containing protein n=1 Tax=Coptis chinensis TaxID=261450 RepID=A0A835HQA1_9MAGN|nr:hypothetical protein IFM89_012956 [Coptis chinensis]
MTLISKRCTRRLGTRMWRRGANLEGDTANFIETEQLLEIEGFRKPLVDWEMVPGNYMYTVRGSIPLLWEQIVDLSYKPRIKIVNYEETPKIVQRHFNDLIQRYGEAMAVDLTDKHGDESQLSMAFATEMQKVPQIRVEHIMEVRFRRIWVCCNPLPNSSTSGGAYGTYPVYGNHQQQVDWFKKDGDSVSNGTQFAKVSRKAGVSTKDAPQVKSSVAKRGDILIDINDRFPRDFLSNIFSKERLTEDSSSISLLYNDGTGLSINIGHSFRS